LTGAIEILRTRVRRFTIALSLATLLASVGTYLLVKLEADPVILVVAAAVLGAVAVAQSLDRGAGFTTARRSAGAAAGEPVEWEARRSAYRTLQLDLLHDLDLAVGLSPRRGDASMVDALAPIVAALSGALATEGASPEVALGLVDEVGGELRLVCATGAFEDVLRPGVDLEGELTAPRGQRGRWAELAPLSGAAHSRALFAIADAPLEQPERELLRWYADLLVLADEAATRPA
jgi:hypothetical protein